MCTLRTCAKVCDGIGFGKRFGRLADCHFDPFGSRSQPSQRSHSESTRRSFVYIVYSYIFRFRVLPSICMQRNESKRIETYQAKRTWQCQPKVGSHQTQILSAISAVCILSLPTVRRLYVIILSVVKFIGLWYFIEWLVINISGLASDYRLPTTRRMRIVHACVYGGRILAPLRRQWSWLSQGTK